MQSKFIRALVALVAGVVLGTAGSADALASAPAATPTHLRSSWFDVSWPAARTASLPGGALISVRVRASRRAPRSAKATIALHRTGASGHTPPEIRRVRTGRVAFTLPSAAGASYELELRAGAMRYRTLISTIGNPVDAASLLPTFSATVPGSTPDPIDQTLPDLASPPAVPSHDAGSSTDPAPTTPLCSTRAGLAGLKLDIEPTVLSASESMTVKATNAADCSVAVSTEYRWEHLTDHGWQSITDDDAVFAQRIDVLEPSSSLRFTARTGDDFPPGLYRLGIVVTGQDATPFDDDGAPFRAVSAHVELR